MWRKANIVKLAVFVALAASVLGVAAPSAHAAPLENPENHMEKATEQWLRYRALYYCFNAGKTFVNYVQSYDELLKADFFNGESTAIGYLNEDGKVSCSDEAFVDNSARIMGWDGIEDMVCSMSIVDCSGDLYVFNQGDTSPEASFKAAKGKLPDTADYPFDPPGYMWYYMYKRTLETFCGGGNTLTSESSATSYKSEYAVSAYYVNPNTGTITRVNYDMVNHKDGDTINDIYSGTGTGGNGDSMDKKCYEISDKTQQHSVDYSDFIINWYNDAIAKNFKDNATFSAELKKKICGPIPPGDGGDLPTPAERAYAACIANNVVGRFDRAVDACKNSSELNADMEVDKRTAIFKKCLKDKLPDSFNATINGIDDPTFEDAASETVDGDTTTECAVEGIGWAVCPVLKFIAELNDQAYGFLAENFLSIETSLLTDNDTFAAWKSFRDIANVLFAIAFMIIIYSQLTSAGISNYGIKRMLPRLVVAALLVNLSYYICQLAVDVSNIAGASIVSLFDAIPSAGAGTPTGSGTWEAVVATVLAVAVGVALVVLVVFAPSALLALGMILLILVIRKALVILLVVISPVAFVAYLLPNTEQYFKKWYKMFGAVLAVYPIIGAVFGASMLAAKIVSNAASGDPLVQATALGISAVPLFTVPALLKGSLSAAGVLGQKLASLSDRANKKAAGDFSDRAGKEMKAIGDSLNRRALNREGVMGGVLGARARGRARREKRFDSLDRQRKSAETAFGVSDARASQRERAALGAEETASKLSQTLQNEVKLDHLQANVDLHTRSIESGLNLHNAEETHESEVKAEHQRANPNQYDALNEARGELKNEQLETDRRFEASAAGRAQAGQRQDLEDQLNVVKTEQTRDYKGSAQGQANAQALKVVQGDVNLADSAANVVYEQSVEGQAQSVAAAELEGELSIAKSENKELFESSAAGQDIAIRQDAAEAQATITKSVNQEASIQANAGVRTSAKKGTLDVKLAESVLDASAETEHIEDNAAAYAEVDVTQQELAAAKTAQEALQKEMTSDSPEAQAAVAAAGIAPTVAAAAQAAAQRLNVERQRSASADRVLQKEQAEAIRDSFDVDGNPIPGGAAEVAGGIDPYGASRARAVASQVLDKQLGEVIEQEHSTLESVNPGIESSGRIEDGGLFSIVQDRSASAERRAAAAQRILEVGGDQHVQLLADMISDLQYEVDASGNPVLDASGNPVLDKDAIIIKKQFASKIGGRKPFGYGKTDLAQFAIGGEVPSYAKALKTRLGKGKVGTEEILTTIGDDELARMVALAESGAMPDSVYNDLIATLDEIDASDTLKTRPTPEQRRLFTDLRNKDKPSGSHAHLVPIPGIN